MNQVAIKSQNNKLKTFLYGELQLEGWCLDSILACNLELQKTTPVHLQMMEKATGQIPSLLQHLFEVDIGINTSRENGLSKKENGKCNLENQQVKPWPAERPSQQRSSVENDARPKKKQGILYIYIVIMIVSTISGQYKHQNYSRVFLFELLLLSNSINCSFQVILVQQQSRYKVCIKNLSLNATTNEFSEVLQHVHQHLAFGKTQRALFFFDPRTGNTYSLQPSYSLWASLQNPKLQCLCTIEQRLI